MEKIYEAINAIMGEIGAIGKNKKNDKQGYWFRGIDDVYNVLNPAFIKNKVFALPEIIEQEREERQNKNGGLLIYSICRIKYTFCSAEDGSKISVVVVGEGMDNGDKASNKAMAAAFKYACFQVFCIPTEEMAKDDADNYSPEPQPPVIGDKMITQGQIRYIREELKRTGIYEATVVARYHKKDIATLTFAEAEAAIKGLKNTKDAEDKPPFA